MCINISFNFSESNSSLLDGKLGNAQSLSLPLSSVVVSLLKTEVPVGTGCFLTRSMIITSNVNSKNLYYLRRLNNGLQEKVIYDTARAFFNGNEHKLSEILNLNRLLYNSLLFDVALIRVGLSII